MSDSGRKRSSTLRDAQNCSAGSRESGHNAPLHSDEKPGRRERRGRAKREEPERKPRRYRVRGPSGGQNLCPMSGQASARKQYIYRVSCIRVAERLSTALVFVSTNLLNPLRPVLSRRGPTFKPCRSERQERHNQRCLIWKASTPCTLASANTPEKCESVYLNNVLDTEPSTLHPCRLGCPQIAPSNPNECWCEPTCFELLPLHALSVANHTQLEHWLSICSFPLLQRACETAQAHVFHAECTATGISGISGAG